MIAQRMLKAAALAAVAAGTMAAASAAPQDRNSTAAEAAGVRFDTPSGLPVPRFVSLKDEKTFCRAGPSFAHPVRITFIRRSLPVMVIAETTDHWRKIRDSEGDECWAHKTKLSGARTVLVLTEGLPLRARPNEAAPMRARLGGGLVARVEGTRGDWLKVSADGLKGWAKQSGFWGAGSTPVNAATRN